MVGHPTLSFVDKINNLYSVDLVFRSTLDISHLQSKLLF